MHSKYHHYQLLLLLLTLGHAMAGDNQLKKFSDKIVAFFVLLDAFVLLILLWIIYVFCKKQKMHEPTKENCCKDIENVELKRCEVNENADGVGSDEKIAEVSQEQRKITFVKGWGGFDLDDLLRASAEGLGKGSFGSCYKAKLDVDREVVVKRLRDLDHVTKEEFTRHMRMLSSLEHPNLLPLLGYCYLSLEKLLITNYACNGNLFNRIHEGRGGNRVPFTWTSRLLVAHDVARAMEFLHLNMEESSIVPHGNLKASNVLLDENDKPLVCDYGLAPLIPTSLAVQRMLCYKSPEYQQHHSISRKTDVWSYGCLLLELITGRISVNSAPGGIHGGELCYWVNRAVREEWTGEVFDIEILIQKRASSGMIMLLKLALWCCDWLPEKRPEIEEVAREVERITAGEADTEDHRDQSSIDEATSRTNNGSGNWIP